MCVCVTPIIPPFSSSISAAISLSQATTHKSTVANPSHTHIWSTLCSFRFCSSFTKVSNDVEELFNILFATHLAQNNGRSIESHWSPLSYWEHVFSIFFSQSLCQNEYWYSCHCYVELVRVEAAAAASQLIDRTSTNCWKPHFIKKIFQYNMHEYVPTYKRTNIMSVWYLIWCFVHLLGRFLHRIYERTKSKALLQSFSHSFSLISWLSFFLSCKLDSGDFISDCIEVSNFSIFFPFSSMTDSNMFWLQQHRLQRKTMKRQSHTWIKARAMRSSSRNWAIWVRIVGKFWR